MVDNNEENESGEILTPEEISDKAKEITLNLLPAKPKEKYEKQYKHFMDWCIHQNVRKYSENVILTYLSELSEKYKSSTLWSIYSMLKTTLLVKHDSDIKKYLKVTAFLKKKAVGHIAKKSKIFSREEINTFLTNASNELYLMAKGTTISIPPNGYHHYPRHHTRCDRNGSIKPSTTTIDIGYSDETSDTYYEYYDQNDFKHSPLKVEKALDPGSFAVSSLVRVKRQGSPETLMLLSQSSGSTRLPYFEFDDESNRFNQRYSRTSFSDRSTHRPKQSGGERVSKDVRKIYPNQEGEWDRLYHEIQTPCDNVVPVATNMPRRAPPSRLSDRPQSSMSSGVASAMVYGCGGKCQTFENVCYFFLQLVFTMGILIGVSLCIAGVVLRKSAARNLQVLVYIGVLLAMVCALLLGIQCNARSTARKRKKAFQMAKRAPIQMETFNIRQNPLQQPQHLLAIRESQRKKPLPQVHNHNLTINRPLPPRPYHNNRLEIESSSVIEEEQGIPWWRRKDLNTR